MRIGCSATLSRATFGFSGPASGGQRLMESDTRIQHLDNQFVNLLQGEVHAASAVIVASVLVFSDFSVFEVRRCCFFAKRLCSPERLGLRCLELPQSSTSLFLSKRLTQSQNGQRKSQKKDLGRDCVRRPDSVHRHGFVTGTNAAGSRRRNRGGRLST